jgi:hypothetical protein
LTDSEFANLPDEHNTHSVWEGTTYSSTAGELIAPLLDKTGGQTHEGNISLLPGKVRAEHGTDKALARMGQLSNTVGKARHCTALEKLGASLN